MPTPSNTKSYIFGRDIKPLRLTQTDLAEAGALDALDSIGIQFAPAYATGLQGFGADDAQGLFTTASIGTPIQFLQTWLPGFVLGMTAVRKADELFGIQTAGEWHHEEVVQGQMELTGDAHVYGDITPVPLSSWNLNFERRSIVRFEEGLKVGPLEDERAAEVRVNSAAEKRNAAAQALEVSRNVIAFSGYNSGNNRTYGALNDPGLPAYVNVPNGASSSPLWSTKTFLEILADIRVAVNALLTQSNGVADPTAMPTTLALPLAAVAYLSVVNVQGTQSVRQWIAQTYPQMRVTSAPQLNAANGAANVFYLYADSIPDSGSDGGATWAQIVPAKFRALGVAKDVKAYTESYSNATAGIMCKRPFAVVRYSGI